ncbi:MAG: flagella basal body P-ring formation protein FlgA [Myxococcota bacterium]
MTRQRTAAWFRPTILLCLSVLAALPNEGLAQRDVVRLSEIVPLLAGTAAGNVIVADAPTLGGERRIRRSEVLAALAEAGLSAEGLAIPRVTRIRRERVTLDEDAIADRARPLIAERLAPCEIERLRLPRRVVLPAGNLEMSVEVSAPTRGSRTSGTLIVRARSAERRLPFSAQLRCPPPAVRAGSRVTAVARIGSVRATAPAEATQPGRIGDVIRIRNLATRRALTARVIDAETVEVLH